MIHIPAKRIPIILRPCDPTTLTVDSLKNQLTSVGLTCPQAEESKLSGYIDEVKTRLPRGSIQSFQIFKKSSDANDQELATKLAATGSQLVESSKGNWEPDSTAIGYGPQLEYIQYKDHFDWLKSNRPTFTGVESEPYVNTGKFLTISAIKNLFVSVGTTASAALVKGLDKTSIESILSNAISPLPETTKNLDQSSSRVIFLVEDYDPVTKEAAAIGVLTISWHLVIKNYKKKKKAPKHNTTLTINAWSVLYSDINFMEADFNAALSHFKNPPANHLYFAELGKGIPAKDSVKIFDKRPEANFATFVNSVPVISVTESADVLVMFAPSLELIGTMDNSGSHATSQLSVKVTRGFTFTTEQSITIGSSLKGIAKWENPFEAGVELEVNVSLTLSFTESWNTTQEKAISFTCPPGVKTFVYQGVLQTQILRFDAKTATYSYRNSARVLTEAIATYDVILPEK